MKRRKAIARPRRFARPSSQNNAALEARAGLARVALARGDP